MYATLEQKGKVITVWGDTVGNGNVSTTAALLAAEFAAKEKKTLMLSTDLGPYDGVSVLSDLIVDNEMDNLLILASSGGLKSPEEMLPYVTEVSDYLSCLKGTNEFEKISVSAVAGLKKIIQMASYQFDYIVIDVYGTKSSISDMLVSLADLVVFCATQNKKHLDTIDASMIFTKDLAEKDAIVVLTKYQIYDFMPIKQLEKDLNVSGIYTISDDDEVHQAVCNRNIADYVFNGVAGVVRGFLGIKKKAAEKPIVIEELDEITSDIEAAFKEQAEDLAAEMAKAADAEKPKKVRRFGKKHHDEVGEGL